MFWKLFLGESSSISVQRLRLLFPRHPPFPFLPTIRICILPFSFLPSYPPSYPFAHCQRCICLMREGGWGLFLLFPQSEPTPTFAIKQGRRWPQRGYLNGKYGLSVLCRIGWMDMHWWGITQQEMWTFGSTENSFALVQFVSFWILTKLVKNSTRVSHNFWLLPCTTYIY